MTSVERVGGVARQVVAVLAGLALSSLARAAPPSPCSDSGGRISRSARVEVTPACTHAPDQLFGGDVVKLDAGRGFRVTVTRPGKIVDVVCTSRAAEALRLTVQPDGVALPRLVPAGVKGCAWKALEYACPAAPPTLACSAYPRPTDGDTAFALSRVMGSSVRNNDPPGDGDSPFEDPRPRRWSQLLVGGKADALLTAVERDLVSDQPHPYASHVWAVTHRRRGDLAAAIVDVKDAALRRALGALPRLLLLVEEQRWDEAIDEFPVGRISRADGPWTLLLLAQAARARQDPDLEKRCLDALTALHLDFFVGAPHRPQTLATLEKWLGKAPRDPRALAEKSRLLAADGKAAEAAAALETAQKMYPFAFPPSPSPAASGK